MIISGKNSVLEALKADKTINKISVLKNSRNASEIVALAREKGVRFEFVSKAILDKKSVHHQGVVAEVVEFEYSSVEDILKKAEEKSESPLIVILDGIEDPHNFGAIIRSCECVGAHGVIISKHRQVAVNETVVKTSAGAISNLLISRVTNINQTIDYLKQKGVWVYGLEASGKSIYKTNLTGSVALVIGSEGSGISMLTQKKCDEIVSLPLYGKVNSLNASVACGISVYEVMRQRKS